MWTHGRSPANSLMKSARGDRAAGAAAGVGEVGDLALELLLVVVEDRHRPRAVAGALAGARAPARPTPSACRTGRWSSCRARRRRRRSASRRRPGAWRRAARAYQSASPSTSRPSASVFRISTVLPSALVRTSPGLTARAARHVLGHRDDADAADRRLEPGDRRHRADDRGAARHVVLHLVHVLGRLDRDAAGVERDALADQAEDDAGHRVRPARGAARRGAAAPGCRARRRAAGPSSARRSAVSSSTSTCRPAALPIASARSANTRGVSVVARLVGELARQVAALAEDAAALERLRRSPPAPAAMRSSTRSSQTRGRVLGLVRAAVVVGEADAFGDHLRGLLGGDRGAGAVQDGEPRERAAGAPPGRRPWRRGADGRP